MMIVGRTGIGGAKLSRALRRVDSTRKVPENDVKVHESEVKHSTISMYLIPLSPCMFSTLESAVYIVAFDVLH